jgi:SAM-dependent methyltransferase
VFSTTSGDASFIRLRPRRIVPAASGPKRWKRREEWRRRESNPRNVPYRFLLSLGLSSAVVTADSALEEFRESGLAADSLTGNSAKLRLTLDLAALASRLGRLLVLDVGCAGPEPLNLWQPFVPLRDLVELVGVDVAGLDRTAARARELGLDVELRHVSASGLTGAFGEASFDVVVSTQVLEHLHDWRDGLRECGRVLRPGGTLFVTCDSADVRATLGNRTRLSGKRAYAALRRRVPAVGKVGDSFVSGEWERGLRKNELGEALSGAGLEVERLEWYCLHCVKVAQRHAGSATRLLWLSMEEALAKETAEPVDPSLYAIIYAKARRIGGPNGRPG